MPGTYIQLLDKTLSTEEQECAIHAVARQCARCYMEPVATAQSHEALIRALASQPRYADVLATLYEWVSASPRALEHSFEPLPIGAHSLAYPTLDLYLLPRAITALSLLCAHAQKEDALDAADLDVVQEAMGATMRLVGTILHVCLASSHQQTHARFILYDALRCGARGLVACGCISRDTVAKIVSVDASHGLYDASDLICMTLCGNDPVPEPFALRPSGRTSTSSTVGGSADVMHRASGTGADVWMESDAAIFSVTMHEPLAARTCECLVLLCTRIASELGAVFPFLMRDLAELGTHVILAMQARSSRWTHMHYDAILASLPLLSSTTSFYPMARMCFASFAHASDMDERVCAQLTEAFRLIYQQLSRLRREYGGCTLPPETDSLMGDPRSLLSTLLARASVLPRGSLRECCVAYLCTVFALLDEDVLTDEQWQCVDDMDEDAWREECERLHSTDARSASPSLHASLPDQRTPSVSMSPPPTKRARMETHQHVDARTAASCATYPCAICDAVQFDPAALTTASRDLVRSPAPLGLDELRHARLSNPTQALHVLDVLLRFFVHATDDAILSCDTTWVIKTLRCTTTHIHRGVRIRTGRVIYVYVLRCACFVRTKRSVEQVAGLVSIAAHEATATADHKVQETSILALAHLGCIHDETCFALVIQALIRALYTPHIYIRALVVTETIQLAVHRRCTTFQLLAQQLDTVCNVVASQSTRSMMPALAEIARLVGMHVPTFLQTTLAFTLPLLLERMAAGHNSALGDAEALAAAVGRSVPAMCLAHVSDVFKHAFLKPPALRDASLQAFLSLLGSRRVTVANLLRSRLHDVLGWLVVHLGAEAHANQAYEALEFVRATVASGGKWRGMDLTMFLQEEVLAILTWINDELGGLHGKLRTERRVMAVRSIGALVQRIGAVAARVAPQVLASLTSTLHDPSLSEPTLESWLNVVQALRGADLGVLVGPTAAALLSVWPRLDVGERRIAAEVLRFAILERTTDAVYLNDVPSLDAIADDVPDVAQRVRATRQTWNDEAQLAHILERVSNDSAAICVQSLHELRVFLREQRACIEAWTTGNVFHSLIGRCVRVLMAVAARSELSDAVPVLCLECLGLLGAVDPDRLDMPPDEPILVLLSDFDNADETIAFAQRTLVDVVAPAFRATHDTKHQAALAYAIQELLKFCQFTPALLDASAPSRVPEKVCRRWASLPETLLPTLLPLLNSRYVVQLAEPRARDTPLYAHSTSYRDWIQAWTLALIRSARPGDAATLFGMFSSVVRDHDVGIAQYLLPHLVLHVLISGTHEQRHAILMELVAVLADQAQPALGYDTERRRLTAQTLFTVLDHVGQWMRRMRLVPPRAAKRSRWRDALTGVQAVMDELSPDLLAQASLQCDAYARALLHFEYRIRAMRQTQQPEMLQPYYETMHEIYASLDDPDGMEGISTKVLSPSLEHQIREHESTGRWTDAQSCWEVELQQRPDDMRLHIGLLRCLRNLGHYDTLRTHIRGVLAVHPTWQPQLAPFQIEGACILADWDAVRELVHQSHTVPELGMARALIAMRDHDEDAFRTAVSDARCQLGRRILGPARVSYSHAYDAVTRLHMLCELELIFHGRGDAHLGASLDSRFAATLPSFRTREPVLSLRRSAFHACRAPASDLGSCWILSAKTARKAGHTQSAYSAILQAMQSGAPYAFVQKAKLLAHGDQVQAALQTLNNALQCMDDGNANDHCVQPEQDRRALAQAHLLRARLVEETARFQQNDIIQHYKTCTSLDPDSEKIWYYLGHFYDAPGGGAIGNQMLLQLSVCRFYMKSAQHGTKFLYRTLPRMLTIWLDAGNELIEPASGASTKASASSANSASRSDEDARQAQQQFDKINEMMLKSVRHLARYQWFAVLPQLVARIVHKNEAVWQVLLEIIVAVVVAYPQQGVWAILAGSHSKDKRRKQRYECIVERISSVAERAYRDVVPVIEAAERVSTELLHLCDFHVHRETSLSMQQHFPALVAAMDMTPLILPVQSSVNVILPPNNQVSQIHRPFPNQVPMIIGFDDTIEIMHSLQKPRKIIIHASDGHRYPFLCKPRDDLRKDARLMEFDSMINKLLQSNSESRRRRLYIRTYAVIILNEECGLIEWVPNTVAFRQILTKHYASMDIPMYTPDLKKILDEARLSPKHGAAIFEQQILPRYPPVFHAWFLETFPEPSAWFKARSAYARTAAVMSIVGFVLGLGDRHGDNILFDAGSGDTVHVDLNCLFEKGMTFEIPERVPFRLTHNMVDALGVAGVEGAFRKTADITMSILRDNKDSLMSVLQAMVHDPLGEWVATERRARHKHGDKQGSGAGASAGARRALKSVSDKLDGRLRRPGLSDEVRHTTKNLVHMLICDATSAQNLSQMYVGWAPYL